MAAEQTGMHDHDKAHAGPGAAVAIRVKASRKLDSMLEFLGMPSRQKAADGRETRKSPRVAVQKPFSYRMVRNHKVMPETFHGTILNIGYNGMLAELNQPLPDHSEIKLKLDTLLSDAKALDIDAGAAEIQATVIDTRPINGWNVSGLEFTNLTAQSEKLLMHCMLHTAHHGNMALDEHLWQHERDVSKKTDAWQITKRIILATLLAASAALFYLIWILTDALTIVN